ncbi:hypothetical protein BH24ACT1_BH24ACT1_03290 [soil metagenome]
MLSHHLFRRAVSGTALLMSSVLLVACGNDQAAEDPAPEESTASTTEVSDVAAPSSTNVPEPGVRTISVSFADGAVPGGVRTETVPLDEPVRIEVSGDVEEEVHVHTYDLVDDVAPNDPAVIEFTADIPGVHEVELEGSHLLVLELQVEP